MLLERVKYQANNRQDFVEIKVAGLAAKFGYRVAFSIDQALRLAAKQVAHLYGAEPRFWRQLGLEDLGDCPKAHRGARQSRQRPSCRAWTVAIRNPPLICLELDDQAVEVDIETAVHVGHAIRRAARRAKAWAGDTSRDLRMAVDVTDGNAPASAAS